MREISTILVFEP